MWYTLRAFVRWIKTSLVLLLIIWVAISFSVGSRFDAVCVEGRISAAQAEALNSLEWDKCPSYRNGECAAEWNDRVLVGQCSEFFKFLWKPHKWLKVLDGGSFPWKYGEAPPPF